MPFSISQERRIITVRTSEIILAFSLDDGGLRWISRIDAPNLIGYGEPIPTVDVQLGLAAEWLAQRVFVRYLRHSIEEQNGAIDLVIVIGIGPLMVFDRYHITGTLIARRVSVLNVGEDELRLHGVRLILPWVRAGSVERGRFDAPGNNVRPHVSLEHAAQQRRSILPRRFFAPGLRENSAFEPAPLHGSGLLGVYDPDTHETLLTWYYSNTEAALPQLEGNDQTVSLIHQIELAARLQPEIELSGGTQYILLLNEPWPNALAAFQNTLPYCGLNTLPQPAQWMRDAAIYEVHPAQFGGFLGLASAIPYLRALGFNTICMMPIWEFVNRKQRIWDGNWEDSGDPHTVRNFEQLDATLGSDQDLITLVETAHRNSIRVLLDLPLRGCAVDSNYLLEHPNWFCYNEEGQIIHAYSQPLIARFDWSNPELQSYMLTLAKQWLQEYGIDGYRVVAPRSRTPNWSPRLEHHASGSSIGALQFVNRLRHEMNQQGEQHALIGQFAGPIWSETLDLSLDELAHHMFVHMAMNRISPYELGEWLTDHDRVLPTGTLRACFTETHQTRLINPLADGLRGSRISRMLLTGMLVCGFIPLVWSGQEQGDEGFIRQLLHTWAERPILRYGTRQYNQIQSDNPQIFTIIRRWEHERAIGLLNVGAHRITVTINIPVDSLHLAEGNYSLHQIMYDQLWIEEGRTSWTREELRSFKITLDPFTANCYLIVPAIAPQVSEQVQPDENQQTEPDTETPSYESVDTPVSTTPAIPVRRRRAARIKALEQGSS